jgi:hypothetical protein
MRGNEMEPLQFSKNGGNTIPAAMAMQSNKILSHRSLGFGGTGANVFSKVIDVVIERELVELSLYAVLQLTKVVVQRPVTWVGACNIAASRTYVPGHVPRTRIPSQSDLGRD